MKTTTMNINCGDALIMFESEPGYTDKSTGQSIGSRVNIKQVVVIGRPPGTELPWSPVEIMLSDSELNEIREQIQMELDSVQ